MDGSAYMEITLMLIAISINSSSEVLVIAKLEQTVPVK